MLMKVEGCEWTSLDEAALQLETKLLLAAA
jgi:hypothetical protein